MNPSHERVSENTPQHINDQLRHETEKRIVFYMNHPERVDERLAELDREWDVERLIEVQTPSASLAGLLLGIVVSRKFLVLPVLAQSLLLLHGVQGWYPLLPQLRRLGFRTPKEIATERYALKAIRGDFGRVAGAEGGKARDRADAAFGAAEWSHA